MPNTNPTPLFQVLKPGVHIDANGTRVQFTEADLQAIADGYNPSVHEAPMVVGHPSMDAPAYGWATKFIYRDGVLLAEGGQVEEQFADLVNAGRFKKVSLSLYGPRAPGNPKPGMWYPRHVGFLGAQPPAIKGLKSVQFAEGEDGVHNFSDDYATSTVLRLMRGIRDWMLTQFGQETADRVLPSYELDYATQALVADQVRESMTESTDEEGLAPAFSEATQTGAGADDMSTAQAAALQAQLEAANRRAEEAQQALQARIDADAQAAQNTRQAEAVAFAERMVSEARVPAERRDALVGIHLQLATPTADGQVLSFGEGDAAHTAVAVLEQLVGALPTSVTFGEHATKQGRQSSAADFDDVDGQVQFSEGVAVDPVRLQQHRDALRYQREQKAKGVEVSYIDAARAVMPR